MAREKQGAEGMRVDALVLAQAFVDALSDPAILLDSHLEPRGCNYHFYDLTGQRRQDLERHLAAKRSPFELVGSSVENDSKNARRCLDSNKPIHLAEVPARNSVGDSFVMQQSFVPVTQSVDSAVGVIVILRDTSGEARMHESYKKLVAREKARAERLESEVEQRTRELSNALEQVTLLSRTDPLTGVLNRRALGDLATQTLGLADRHGRSAGLLMCDLDHFKRINDRFGHQAGDAVLKRTAEELQRVVRSTDRVARLQKEDHVARFGGEEFVVFLSEASLQDLTSVAQRCAQAIREVDLSKLAGDAAADVALTISIGVTAYPDHAQDLDCLITCADKAMYRAKQAGRDRVVLYHPDLDEQLVEPSTRLRVLLIDTNEVRAADCSQQLRESFEVTVASSSAQALSLCSVERFDVIVCDQDVGTTSGAAFLVEARMALPAAPCILMADDEGRVLLDLQNNEVRFDSFVLRRFAKANLCEVVEDVLLMKRMRTTTHPAVSVPPRLRRPGSYEADLAQVIAEKKLVMHYQPIVAAFGDKLLGYEALCRPQHPRFACPQELFQIAHELRLLWPLGRLIRALVGAETDVLPVDTLVFINLHPGEVEDPRLGEEAPHADMAHRIVFEVTERASISDLRQVKDNVDHLRGKGYRFAIDDLGAGYASLSSVALIGPDFVKIDRDLINGLDDSPTKQRIVSTIVGFANDEGIGVIAEGVETPSQRALVQQLGCHFMQGYLLGRPAPLSSWMP